MISGEQPWCLQQARRCLEALGADVLWVGEHPKSLLHCQPAALRTLLGREFRHAVFNAHCGLHSEALAALAGTLQAGSWLLLLVPSWESWSQLADADSLRWSESPQPIPAPRFISRLQQLLQADNRVVIWRQPEPLRLSPPATSPDWQADISQQQHLLNHLLTSQPGIHVLTAARGRGKSALAGMLVARWPGRCLVTAPAKVSGEVLAQFAGDKFQFLAPDGLLALTAAQRPAADWLIVDEAAAIPAPLLQRLTGLYPRVLLVTTVQGYEGTGRGFLLKFCDALPDCHYWQLESPLRWAAEDPLESFIAQALLFDDRVAAADRQPLQLQALETDDWQQQPTLMAALYQLLTSAHYRTSPLDLRRMMDAPGMHFSALLQGEHVQGALWLVDEGGLSAELAAAVWAGRRRPRGNLVAQSLAAHAGLMLAPQLKSARISRIAISAALRGQGLGQRLVTQCKTQCAGRDFISVSFGFTPPLWRFWQRCGFRLVRIGSQREASSGCYTAMALLPLSQAGRQLAEQATRRLAREGYWLQRLLDDNQLPLSREKVPDIDEDDWRELAGFAWGLRPYEASLAALGRLISQPGACLPLLQAALLNNLSVAQICQQYQLSGRKVLLQAWRQEVQQALMLADARRGEQLRAWVEAMG